MGGGRSIVVALLGALLTAGLASAAAAQDDGDAVGAETEGATDGDAAGGDAAGGDAAGGDAAGGDAADPDGAGGPEAPTHATSSVVVDDREAELEREQAAMEREAAEGEGGVAPTEDEEEDDGESLDHEYQVGIRLGAGVPFQFALRYGGNNPACDDDGSTFCVFVGSGILDGELSFGVTPDLEITAMGRVGMVPVQPTDDRQILVGLGIRSYLSPESLFKFFLGVKAILDLTPANGEMFWGPVDFGVRGEAGVQLDIVRYVGLYIQLAVNVTFLRAFAISPDATGGVQIRFP